MCNIYMQYVGSKYFVGWSFSRNVCHSVKLRLLYEERLKENSNTYNKRLIIFGKITLDTEFQEDFSSHTFIKPVNFQLHYVTLGSLIFFSVCLT